MTIWLPVTYSTVDRVQLPIMLLTFDMPLLAFGISVVLITPGPTNTLLATAGLRHGFRSSAPLIAAELWGYLISISVWGIFLVAATEKLPWLLPTLRMACGIYLAWLAIRMWPASRTLAQPERRLIGMRSLFIATLLNPKGLLFASLIFPKSAFTDLGDYLAAMVEFIVLLVPIGLGWIALGRGLGSGKLSWPTSLQMQRGASIVLSVFSLCLVWAAIR